jgi:CO dehydrogenase/acetyl-CoA synthase gamma subunit (corrinoid Fe-S protein)
MADRSRDLIAVTEAVEVMNQAMNVVKEKKKLFDQAPKTQEQMIELYADLDVALARASDASHKVHAMKWPAGWRDFSEPATANDTQ